MRRASQATWRLHEPNLRRSCACSREIAEGHEALGAVLVELGKPLEGAREFEAAAKIKPGDDAIETNLALAYAQAGESAKAIPHFQAAESLSRQPGHAGARCGFLRRVWRALAAVGKPDRLPSQFIAEEALTGPRADIEDAIGTLDAQQSKWAGGAATLRARVALDQTYFRARVHLAIVLRSQKDLQGALEHAAPAADVGPPNAEALVEVGARSLQQAETKMR